MKKLMHLFRRHTTRKPAAAPAEEREYLVVYEEAAGRPSIDWSIRATSADLARKAFADAGLICSRIVGIVAV